MGFTTTQRRRIKKVITFLENLSPKRFCINYYADSRTHNENDVLKYYQKHKKFPPRCNFTACCIGYLPFIFPKLWHYRYSSHPQLIKNSSDNSFRDCRDFLGISGVDSDIFTSSSDNTTPKRMAKTLSKLLHTPR